MIFFESEQVIKLHSSLNYVILLWKIILLQTEIILLEK